MSHHAPVRDHLAKVRHDLGRYVAMSCGWVGDDAPLGERLDALRADLLHTRRAADVVVDAASLWGALRPPLVGDAPLEDGSRVDLRGRPAFDAVDACMQRVARVIVALREGREDEATARDGLLAAREAAAAIRVLERAAREEQWPTSSS